MASDDAMKKADAALRAVALGFPETYEEFPWGHRAVKVKGKAFVFMALENGRFSLSTKLPISSEAALMFSFASPTGYGLGKSGWITAAFEKGAKVPVDLLSGWLEESYRAIAPKKLSARLAEGVAASDKSGASQSKTGASSRKAGAPARKTAMRSSHKTEASRRKTGSSPRKTGGTRRG